MDKKISDDGSKQADSTTKAHSLHKKVENDDRWATLEQTPTNQPSPAKNHSPVPVPQQGF